MPTGPTGMAMATMMVTERRMGVGGVLDEHPARGGRGDDGDAAEQIDLDDEDDGRAKKRRTGKGWEWVEESVDVDDMTRDERERYERALAKREAAIEGNGTRTGNGHGAADAIEVD